MLIPARCLVNACRLAIALVALLAHMDAGEEHRPFRFNFQGSPREYVVFLEDLVDRLLARIHQLEPIAGDREGDDLQVFYETPETMLRRHGGVDVAPLPRDALRANEDAGGNAIQGSRIVEFLAQFPSSSANWHSVKRSRGFPDASSIVQAFQVLSVEKPFAASASSFSRSWNPQPGQSVVEKLQVAYSSLLCQSTYSSKLCQFSLTLFFCACAVSRRFNLLSVESVDAATRRVVAETASLRGSSSRYFMRLRRVAVFALSLAELVARSTGSQGFLIFMLCIAIYFPIF